MKKQSSKLFIKGLRLTAVIGVHDDERVAAQSLIVDLTLDYRDPAASASDDIGDAINYSEVAAKIGKLAAEGRYRLVEALAEAIAEMLLATYPADQAEVQIAKPRAINQADAAGVRIIRSV